MPKTHIVQQGEHISLIAAENGFNNFHTVWDHPKNAELKAIRDPHVLFPGDQVFIPDLTERIEQRSTGAVHEFVTEIQPLLLRMKLLDLDEKAIANAPCDVAPPPKTGKPPQKTDGKGILEETIDTGVKTGSVLAHVPPKKKDDVEKTIPYDLKIGHLNPISKMSGQQARLNNLGYFAGYTLRDVDGFLWAAEEFLCDHGTRPVTQRPKIKAAPPSGEDDNADPATAKDKTGVQESSTRKTLATVHDGKAGPDA